jgi:hypothetical protein
VVTVDEARSIFDSTVRTGGAVMTALVPAGMGDRFRIVVAEELVDGKVRIAVIGV